MTLAVEYFESLVRHYLWAVERLLDTAARLSARELATAAPDHGTIWETLIHLADVDQSWGRTARGERALDASAVHLDEPGLRREVTPEWKAQTFPVWQIVGHIANHRAEHGSQLAALLTALGHSPGELGWLGWVIGRVR